MIRNFINTLRRYKLSSALNIAGLAIAIAASYILFVQSTYELGYNDNVKDVGRLFRVEQNFFATSKDYSAAWSAPLARMILDGNPTVEEFHFGRLAGGIVDHCFEKSPESPSLKLRGLEFTESAFRALGFELVEGDFEPVSKRMAIAFSRLTAEKYDIQVGDHVSWGATYNPAAAMPVAAIFEDFPENSDLAGLQAAYGDYWNKIGDNNNSKWNNPCYVKLNSADDVEAFYDFVWQRFNEDEKLKEQLQEIECTRETLNKKIRLTPFNETYFITDVENSELASGNRVAVYTMLTMAVLVLLLAFINFFNFYVALIPKRIRSINTQKILGAYASTLRAAILFESLFMGLVAVALAALLVHLVELTDIRSMLSTTLAFGSHAVIAGCMVCAVLFFSLLAAIYPAWYVTSFSPAFVLKGSFGATSSGKMLRNVLIGVQFVIAFIFIITASFIFLQYRFMQTYDMGFEKENIIAFNLGRVSYNHTLADKRETVRSAFMSNPDILDVTFGYEDIVRVGGMSWGRKFGDKNEDIMFKVYPVHYNFLKVMGIDVVEGRDFAADDARSGNRYIFNSVAKEKYGLSVGEIVPGTHDYEASEVVGFCEDFNFRPLQYAIEPYAFYIFPPHDEWNGCCYLYIKTRPGSNFAALSQFIKDETMKLNPNLMALNVEPVLFEQQLADAFYKKEYNQFVVISLFSLLSIVIALMGVFGLVFFETEYRRSEIAIRRVNGALISDILMLFSSRFIKVLAVCFVIAVPVATYFMTVWLQEFAYKTPLHWWVYAAAFLAVALLVVGIVIVSSWRVVTQNPVEVINKIQ